MIRDYLAPLGYEVVLVHDGTAGAARALEERFDAVILDVMLPGADGFEVLHRIRRVSDVPVLMLTARGEETDRIVGLEMGADDYVMKTVSPREILARLRAVTRRFKRQRLTSAEQTIELGNLKIDGGARQATLRTEPLLLTSFEFDLLFSLAKSAGRIRTRDQLLQETAARPQNVFDRSIDVHISSLRKKLGDDPRNPEYIVTVRNTGYMLRRQG